VNTGFLDVLHDPAEDHRARLVSHGIYVELECVFNEFVDQNRMIGCGIDRARHIPIQRARVVHDGHATAAKHVRRPHDHGKADFLSGLASFLSRRGRPAGRLRDAEIPEQLRETAPILCEID
jgi:hypothetical protein